MKKRIYFTIGTSLLESWDPVLMRDPNNEEPTEQNLDAKLNVGFKSMWKTSYGTGSSSLHSREFKSNHAVSYLLLLRLVSRPVKSKKRMQPQDHTWCAQSQNRRFSKMHFVLCSKISKKSYNSVRFVTFLRQPKNMETQYYWSTNKQTQFPVKTSRGHITLWSIITT